MTQRRRSPHNRRGWRANRGSAAVEYAILLPALMVFTLGIMDTGRVLWTRTTLARAAESAARCAAIDAVTCGTTAQIQAYAVTQAYGLPMAAGAFAVTKPACGLQVVATSSFTFVVPWLGAPRVTLSAASCSPL